MRVFVAVDVNDENVVDHIMRIQDAVRVAGKPVESHNLHFTLRFLGEMSPHTTGDISDALAKVRFEPFDVLLQGVGVFGGRRPRILWVGTDDAGGKQLSRLACAINDSLRFLDKPDRPFRPHLTILRVKNNCNIPDIGSRQDSVWGVQRVDRFKLKSSVLSRAGPEYTDITEVRAAWN